MTLIEFLHERIVFAWALLLFTGYLLCTLLDVISHAQANRCKVKIAQAQAKGKNQSDG